MLNSKKILLMLSAAILICLDVQAFAQELQCDRGQTVCVMEDKRLTYGDYVGIFNHDDEIVAVGEVRGMTNKKRRVAITQKMATINKGYQVRHIDDNEVGSIEEHYTIYRGAARYTAGGSFGLATINLAQETSAFSAEGFFEKSWMYGIGLVGRAMYLNASGTAIDVDNGDEKESFQVQGLTLLPAVAYKVFPKSMFTLRPELGLGMTYISMSTAAASLPRSLEKMDTGVSMAARAGLSALYNGFDTWHPMADVAFASIAGARTTTISFGLSKDIR